MRISQTMIGTYYDKIILYNIYIGIVFRIVGVERRRISVKMSVIKHLEISGFSRKIFQGNKLVLSLKTG